MFTFCILYCWRFVDCFYILNRTLLIKKKLKKIAELANEENGHKSSLSETLDIKTFDAMGVIEQWLVESWDIINSFMRQKMHI